jgi:hypothetical protein
MRMCLRKQQTEIEIAAALRRIAGKYGSHIMHRKYQRKLHIGFCRCAPHTVIAHRTHLLLLCSATVLPGGFKVLQVSSQRFAKLRGKTLSQQFLRGLPAQAFAFCPLYYIPLSRAEKTAGSL